MIIALICFAILFVGISLFVLYKICDSKYYKVSEKYKKFVQNVANSSLNLISDIFLLLGSIATITCSVAMLCNASNMQIDYKKALYTKKTIEYRIEHQEDNIVGNELLYNDIIGFNNALRSTKYWANNPWTSWFNNDKIAQLDYIEYEFAED